MLPESDSTLYYDIAKYAAELGYAPTKIKTPFEPVYFAKTIKKFGNRRLCKIAPPNPETKREQKTGFALSFYATKNYSETFHEGVRILCESRKSRRTNDGSNKGCGGCKSGCEGYFYTYTDGKMIGCCHDKLVEIPFITSEHLDEIKRMMKTQHDYWTKHL